MAGLRIPERHPPGQGRDGSPFAPIHRCGMRSAAQGWQGRCASLLPTGASPMARGVPRPWVLAGGSRVARGAAPGRGELLTHGGLGTTILDFSRYLTRQLAVSGHVFGLIASEDPRCGRTVAHCGGLPGFGSHVQWLPDHRVGEIGFAHLTYAPVQQAGDKAFQALLARGGLLPRAAQPAPALAADNLFLDRSAERRRQGLATCAPATVPAAMPIPCARRGSCGALGGCATSAGRLMWKSGCPPPPTSGPGAQADCRNARYGP